MATSPAPDIAWAGMAPRSEAAVPQHEAVVEIQPQETTFAAILFRLIPTPRCGRLFASVYRQIKARIPAEDLLRFEGDKASGGEYQVPMLLLAIRIGASGAAERLFPALQKAIEQGRGVRGLLGDCATIAPELASLTMVEQIIRPVVSDPDFPADTALFRFWLPRIERYVFDRTGGPRCTWMPPASAQRARSTPTPAAGAPGGSVGSDRGGNGAQRGGIGMAPAAAPGP